MSTRVQADMQRDGIAVRRRLRAWSLLALSLSLFFGALVVGMLQYHQMEQRRLETAGLAARYARGLEDRLQRALSSTFALAAVVRQGKGEVTSFEHLADEMLPLYPGVINVQLAPGGVVHRIHPLHGSEKAIGHDLFADARRSKEALLARDTRQLTLAGPFELIQGGVAVVGRFPVFLPEAGGRERFWGFTNALIRIPELLDAAHLHEIGAAGYRYELWRVHPDTGERHIFARNSEEPLATPVEHAFDVPNGRWTLSMEPSGGWITWPLLALELGLAAVFSFAMTGLYFYFSHYALSLRLEELRKAEQLAALNARLVNEVQERKLAQSALEAAHREWADAFDAVRSPVLLHDDQFRIMRANRAYLEQAGKSQEQVVGIPYWEVFPRIGGPLPACRNLIEHGGNGPAEDEFELPCGRIFESHGFRVGAGRYAIHIFQDVTAERQASSRIDHLAHHDLLTGLPNRLLFQERCDQALHLLRRNGKQLAVLLLDLDHFKPVNDSLGHAAGDRLLHDVAERLQSALRRRSDTLARVGGDEFAVLIPEIREPEDAITVARALLAAIGAPFSINDHEVHIGVSIGIAIAPCHGDTLPQLMSAADTAMYRVKQQGRGNFRLAEDAAATASSA